ncbi:MAG: hypothetical protein IKR83_04155 [Bacteroidales bacterium]|nr:hypothetical protein [Bacteroidales bacterium]
MKKLILTMVLAAMCLGANAQREAAYADNTFFWSLGVGGAYYQHSGTAGVGIPAGGLYLGRWLMKPLAFRLAGDVVMAPSYQQQNSGNSNIFVFGSAEFMWDVNATFFHVYNKAIQLPFPVYPLIGLGLAYSPGGSNVSADHDFQAMLGFNFPVRISSRWDAFLEYKCFFLPQTFDGSFENNYMHTAMVGLTRRWSDNPYGRRTAYESRSTSDDWFAGFGAGMSFSSFGFEHMFDGVGKLWIPTPEGMFGRNYSNVWTIRFELSGFFARERYTQLTDSTGRPGRWYTYNFLHADFMLNASHLFNFNRGVKWNFLPYLGAGPIVRYSSRPMFTVAADAGVMARRYIDQMGDFYVDLKYVMAPPRFAGNNSGGGGIFSVGYPMITIGYLYNFGHSTTRYRMPVNSNIN